MGFRGHQEMMFIVSSSLLLFCFDINGLPNAAVSAQTVQTQIIR